MIENSLENLKNNGDLEKLKKVKLGEFVKIINKYIGENLEVGKQYSFGNTYGKQNTDYDNIVNIITINIKKALQEFVTKYNISKDFVESYIKIGNYCLYLYVSVGNNQVSIYEDFVRFDFERTTRKNASSINNIFKLDSLPICNINENIKGKMVDIVHDYNSMNLEDMDLCEVITYLLEGKRQKDIAEKQKDILSYKRQIDDDKKVIAELEDIII